MHTRQGIRTVLKEQKLAPKKRFGQNFLVNQHIVQEILARACPAAEDTIVELGVGLGSMTTPLAKKVKRVIGIEIDA